MKNCCKNFNWKIVYGFILVFNLYGVFKIYDEVSY